MTLAEIFGKLFPVPYKHEKWLSDQNILIGRMRAANTEFFNEQADILQKFQDGNQCSIVMIDILVERVKKHLTTEKNCDSINNDDVIVDTCG